jgi:ATP-binding cassette, subfamily B, bacterial HlyB/CyaB
MDIAYSVLNTKQQRIAIAAALLKRPKILIFDEATSNLDQRTAESFAKTINALKGKVTMLFITHALPKSLPIDEVIQISKEGPQRMKVVPRATAAAAAQASASHPATSTQHQPVIPQDTSSDT